MSNSSNTAATQAAKPKRATGAKSNASADAPVKAIKDVAELKKEINDYFTLDRELKDSAKLLKRMRLKRKACEANIQQWMQQNKKQKVSTEQGSFLLGVRESKQPLNEEYITRTCASFLNGDQKRAAELADRLLNNRPTVQKEKMRKGPGEVGGDAVVRL